MRLDLYLVQKTGLARHQVQKMIESGGVRVAGRVVMKPSAKVRGDETVDYQLPKPALPSALIAESIPLAILYEDEQIAVINKPADLVIHPAAGHPSGTLVNALLARYGSLPEGSDPFKPGIVHRLDKGTSGVIVAARTAAALTHLQQQFKRRQVEKTYLALVAGEPPPTGKIDKPLGRHPKHRQKMSSRTRKGRAAQTEWRVLETFKEGLSWCEIKIHTGRTHQIRVHFAEAGYPLVGDPTYGRRQWERVLKGKIKSPKGVEGGQGGKTPSSGRRQTAATALKNWPLEGATRAPINRPTYGRRNRAFRERISRPALHAWRLAFAHPATGARMTFEAPLPEDLKKMLARLSS